MKAVRHRGWFVCYLCNAECDRGYEVDELFIDKEADKPYERVMLCRECYKYCKRLRRR